MAGAHRWLRTIRDFGVTYAVVDPMQCPVHAREEAKRRAPPARTVVGALRSRGGSGARRCAVDILLDHRLLPAFDVEQLRDHEVFEALERAIDSGRILVVARRDEKLPVLASALPSPKTAAAGVTREAAAARSRPREVDVIEIEHFDHGGAVLWPGAPPRSVELGDDEPVVSGVEALRAALERANACAAGAIRITGHDPARSTERADAVRALLVGDSDSRDAWVGIAVAHASVSDEQAMMKWAAGELGWGCNPGPIDGTRGPRTEAAVRSFQRAYNDGRRAGRFAGTSRDALLAVDGVVGRRTMGALYDCIQRALRRESAEAGAGAIVVTGERRRGHATEPPIVAREPVAIGCGAHHLTSPFVRWPGRRASKRAVEVLFFADGEAPPVVRTGESRAPRTEKPCELYDPRQYALRYVPVAAAGAAHHSFSC